MRNPRITRLGQGVQVQAHYVMFCLDERDRVREARGPEEGAEREVQGEVPPRRPQSQAGSQ